MIEKWHVWHFKWRWRTKVAEPLRRWFPKPDKGFGSIKPTSFWKALWCRWTHGGHRSHSGWPAAATNLFHDIICTKCGARYETTTPNNPQWVHCGPFGKPDRSRPDSWKKQHELDERKRACNRKPFLGECRP